MIFTLEALEAKHGDALVLYHGKNDANRSVVVIDGGPHKVYRGSLRRRLESLRSAGKDLHIPLMMVSHLDEDHIQGLVDLTDELVRMLNPKNLPADIQDLPVHKRPKLPYRIAALWYNGFDRILDNKDKELESLAASVVSLPDGPGDDVRPLSETIAASVAQGLKLRANIDRLGISVNDGSPLILAPAERLLTYAFDPDDQSFYELDPGDEPEDGALKFTVLGPTRAQLIKLHERWDKDLKTIIAKENKKKLEAEGADYEDDSPFNLSSIVVLAEAGGKSMLLTGDARGDYVIESAKQAGLLEDGALHVDLLKLPHHASNYNVEQDFFETFPADHYVVSADGKYENPSLETFEYLFAARAGDDRPFTIYLTNQTGTPGANEAHMDLLVAELNSMAADDPRVTIVYRQPSEPSVVVNLGTEVELPAVE
jgi:hypothetical protein